MAACAVARGGTDGTIIFATNRLARLHRVSSDGGEIETLTEPDPAKGSRITFGRSCFQAGTPSCLPSPLRTGVWPPAPTRRSRVLDLRSPSRSHKVLIRGGSDVRDAPTGHLVYFADGSLRAVRFDLDRLEIIDSAIPSTRVAGDRGGQCRRLRCRAERDARLCAAGGRGLHGADHDVGRSSGQGRGRSRRATCLLVSTNLPRRHAGGARHSRRRQRHLGMGPTRRTFIRITRDPGLDRAPVWSADGQSIFYSGAADGVASVFRQRADGNGTPEQLTKPDAPQFPVSLSTQGTDLVLNQGTGGPNNHDLMTLALGAPAAGAASIRQAEYVVKTPVGEGNGSISPDGRWLAYQSNQSGDWEIYVQPFADRNGARSTVSTSGGTQPRWSPDGRELGRPVAA